MTLKGMRFFRILFGEKRFGFLFEGEGGYPCWTDDAV